MKTALTILFCITTILVMAACEPVQTSDIRFRKAGNVVSPQLDEISGIQASLRQPGVFWVHNDDGPPRVFAIGPKGEDLGYFDIDDAVNVDWEDIAIVPGESRDLLVLADVGDNRAERSRVWLYLVEEPEPDGDGRFSGEHEAFHWISLGYPDGPRDTESISWDPVGERLLVLSKRDQPPRLYALEAGKLLSEDEAVLTYLGEVDRFRPPTPADRREFDQRTPWISQPTAMDISPDGRRAAVLTYRSLYLFDLPAGADWLEGFNANPVEVLGPPHAYDEAVGFDADGRRIWVSTESEYAPLWVFDLGAKSGDVGN